MATIMHSSRNDDTNTLTKRFLEKVTSNVNVRFNGDRPWDIQVKDSNLYKRILTQGSLGLGESYMDGMWECDQIDELMNKVLSSSLAPGVFFLPYVFSWTKAKLVNLQSKSRAFQVGEQHYDIGNDLYKAMLDDSMAYTCGYWAYADNLAQAQIDKLELVCKKLNLQSGMRILDIGCGWGSFAKYAAENHGVDVVGVTISEKQAELGRERCAGLPVEIRLQDYREINEKFDAILSIGMFEHVGHKNYKTYINTVKRCLNDGALSVLHTIGKHSTIKGVDPWISKYVFPNGEIPYLGDICDASARKLVIEDVHNFGPDYDKTLMEWFYNFDRAWPELKNNYSERFYRMWKYYLLICAGSFRSRNQQLLQIVFSNKQSSDAYRRPLF